MEFAAGAPQRTDDGSLVWHGRWSRAWVPAFVASLAALVASRGSNWFLLVVPLSGIVWRVLAPTQWVSFDLSRREITWSRGFLGIRAAPRVLRFNEVRELVATGRPWSGQTLAVTTDVGRVDLLVLKSEPANWMAASDLERIFATKAKRAPSIDDLLASTVGTSIEATVEALQSALNSKSFWGTPLSEPESNVLAACSVEDNVLRIDGLSGWVSDGGLAFAVHATRGLGAVGCTQKADIVARAAKALNLPPDADGATIEGVIDSGADKILARLDDEYRKSDEKLPVALFEYVKDHRTEFDIG